MHNTSQNYKFIFNTQQKNQKKKKKFLIPLLIIHHYLTSKIIKNIKIKLLNF